MEWSEIGERVRESRLAAGLSQDELARAVGLDRTMIAKIEAGVRRLDALELVRLSSVLGVPLDHFLSSRPQVLSRRSPLAEDTDSDAARDTYRIEAALSSWVRDLHQLAKLGVLQPNPVLLYPSSWDGDRGARDAARWVRDRLHLGAEAIPTLMTVCESAGQFVLVTDLPGEGASLVDGDIAAAVVSKQVDPGRRRATAAHELGHLVLGDEYSSDLGVAASRQEREAAIDAFAAELLLPADVVAKECAGGGPVRERMVKLAASYRTSWTLAIRQAVQAGVVSQEMARTLRAKVPTRAELMEAVGWVPQADLEPIRVPPSYARAVTAAWRLDLITSARAVELMHGQISEEDLPTRDDLDFQP